MAGGKNEVFQSKIQSLGELEASKPIYLPNQRDSERSGLEREDSLELPNQLMITMVVFKSLEKETMNFLGNFALVFLPEVDEDLAESLSEKEEYFGLYFESHAEKQELGDQMSSKKDV